ncbi:MAG TPA: hypothetical protein VJ876_06270, partial [Bacteroidales bacterium]|nr:hypothetical protein [Bacteroidales bacterium]
LNKPKDEPVIFNFLQIRPIVDNEEDPDIDLTEVNREDALIYSDSALGNGKLDEIYDFVYVKPQNFTSLKSKEIAYELSNINEQFKKEGRNYILVGPGRWGTADPSLGIPVKWAYISQARVIVESGLDNYRIDPSQGTHFFQNLTSFRIGYFTINPYLKDGHYDLDYLDQCKPTFENEYIKHIQFKHPLKTHIDGKNSKGVIFKPQPDN